MPRLPTEIEYGEKYYDDYFEYRSVVLPKAVFRMMPHTSGTLSESEWRALGIQQSRGWVHYSQHRPEPYILLFRRPKGTDPATGLPPRGFKYPEEINSTDINNCDNKGTTKEQTNQQTNWRLEGFNNTQ